MIVTDRVHFDHDAGQAIPLRDPVTDHLVGTTPEWDAGSKRAETSAYVRATRPTLRVVFRGAPQDDGNHVVAADGVPVSIEQTAVDLRFDPATGQSNAVTLRTCEALPDVVGVHDARLDWHVRSAADASLRTPAGTTRHRICTTWRAMRPDSDQGLAAWAYKPLVEWTCEWAAGRQDDEKEVCDAIIRGIGGSSLRYGQPLRVRGVRHFLLNGGGMCGEWYRVFQLMAHCQGVFVHRRSFLVDWRSFPDGEQRWCAIVIRSGGMNQPCPSPQASTFHDNDVEFPIIAPVSLARRTEQRYRFWGKRDYYSDGHCINFLEHKGKLYLYDACFGAGPFEIESPLPPNDYASVWGGAQLASFKARYLDTAVDYLLGSVYNGGVLVATDYSRNGMTVKTALIPEDVRGTPGVTFRWGA